MFIFTYVPQAFILQFVNGPFAWITTAALVLSESGTIITALSKNFVINESLIDVFDLVLISEKQSDLVKNGREVTSVTGDGNHLGKLLKRPLSQFSPDAIIKYLMWLPLNFVPVVGTLLFILSQGREQGPLFHERYFQLKSYSKKQKDAFIGLQKPKYLAFGTICILLQLVPGANIIFLFTNTVGAALWAAELERKGLTPEGEDKTGMELSEGANSISR